MVVGGDEFFPLEIIWKPAMNLTFSTHKHFSFVAFI